jgi:hypothetical protein
MRARVLRRQEALSSFYSKENSRVSYVDVLCLASKQMSTFNISERNDVKKIPTRI